MFCSIIYKWTVYCGMKCSGCYFTVFKSSHSFRYGVCLRQKTPGNRAAVCAEIFSRLLQRERGKWRFSTASRAATSFCTSNLTANKKLWPDLIRDDTEAGRRPVLRRLIQLRSARFKHLCFFKKGKNVKYLHMDLIIFLCYARFWHYKLILSCRSWTV